MILHKAILGLLAFTSFSYCWIFTLYIHIFKTSFAIIFFVVVCIFLCIDYFRFVAQSYILVSHRNLLSRFSLFFSDYFLRIIPIFSFYLSFTYFFLYFHSFLIDFYTNHNSFFSFFLSFFFLSFNLLRFFFLNFT